MAQALAARPTHCSRRGRGWDGGGAPPARLGTRPRAAARRTLSPQVLFTARTTGVRQTSRRRNGTTASTAATSPPARSPQHQPTLPPPPPMPQGPPPPAPALPPTAARCHGCHRSRRRPRPRRWPRQWPRRPRQPPPPAPAGGGRCNRRPPSGCAAPARARPGCREGPGPRRGGDDAGARSWPPPPRPPPPLPLAPTLETLHSRKGSGGRSAYACVIGLGSRCWKNGR